MTSRLDSRVTPTAFTSDSRTSPWTLRAASSGLDKLIGRSNNSDAEVVESVSMGVDYVAVGAVFPTTTVGKGARQAIGLDGIRRARDLTDLSLVAIGGINETNVASVMKAGADCVAVISAVTMADDPEAAARRLGRRNRRPQGADPEYDT